MKELIGIAVLLVAVSVSYACEVDGKKYGNGDKWIKSNFEMQCIMPGDGSWHTTIIACLAPGSIRVPVNSELVQAGKKFTCKKLPDGKVQFGQGPA